MIDIYSPLALVPMLLGSIWTCIRIYETKTVQRWLGNKDHQP